MASSPRRPAAPFRASRTPTTVLADVISYGYAFVLIWATLAFDLQFTLVQGVAVMVLFVVLRAVARELHKDARREQLREAKRIAILRTQSPSRWTVEQRDGLGRRIDLGA